MKKKAIELRAEMRKARRLWPELDKEQIQTLRSLLQKNGLLVSTAEIIRIDGRWYVTHAGLLQLARRKNCLGIRTSAQVKLCDPASQRWVFKAVVYKDEKSTGFVGYGDADPSNISLAVRGAEMRIAETRATCRALRKAYGIGLSSAEELRVNSRASVVQERPFTVQGPSPANGNGAGQPRLRDQLCLLIRQFQLDPSLVKSYAADYCGTPSISAADRESVEAFVSHLKKLAEDNRDALICKLNSYAPAEAGT